MMQYNESANVKRCSQNYFVSLYSSRLDGLPPSPYNSSEHSYVFIDDHIQNNIFLIDQRRAPWISVALR